ncbi:hypothetical protein BSLG_005883 [Batrachochytrium salamandrivorans]|nr:hypothetical protein BSLG_005883 [Batrachochytrium salamandrivorans]
MKYKESANSTIAAIGVSSAIDFQFYQTWTFTPYEFLKLNVLQNIAEFYGGHPFHCCNSTAGDAEDDADNDEEYNNLDIDDIVSLRRRRPFSHVARERQQQNQSQQLKTERYQDETDVLYNNPLYFFKPILTHESVPLLGWANTTSTSDFTDYSESPITPNISELPFVRRIEQSQTPFPF